MPMWMESDFLQKRRWDAQQSLIQLIGELEAQADYDSAARCRAVLSRMLSNDVSGAVASSGAVSDAAGTQAGSATAQIFAALKWSMEDAAQIG